MSEPTARDALIAMNLRTDVQRAVLCRLGLDAERWLHADAGRVGALARELAVPEDGLSRLLATRRDAATSARAEIDAAGALGARVVTVLDASYPERLRELTLPPPVLYVLGEIPSGPALAAVGSRACSDYGREAARFFAAQVAAHAVPVVSGLARGVDQAAHGGALEPPAGRTVAVLGCGLDVPYPSRSRRLARRIGRRGALVSEFPLGTPPHARNFPVRNRIIAALGDATLVVEAAPRSGSLITARYALELGRDIFALPGRIFDEKALGTNALLRDGAAPALHPIDILRAIGVDAPVDAGDEPAPPLGEPAATVWSALPRGKARDPEGLVATLDLDMPTLLGALLELELGGWVERFPGPKFCRRSGRT